jgi:hypothetical protein
MKLYADTTNGILRHGDDSYVTEYLDEKWFIKSLPNLKDQEYICCENISLEGAAKIQAEYGIH